MDTALRRARLTLALLVALFTVQLAGMQPAAAATSVTFVPRTVSAPPGGVHNVVALGSVSLAFTASQTAYVVSVLRANSASYRILVDNEVRCIGPGGWTKNMVVGQNVYASGGDPWDDIQLTTRYLVHPGVAGTVTCTTYSRTASLGHTTESIYLASGSLQFADQSVDNATSGNPIQASVVSSLAITPSSPTVREPATGMFDIAAGKSGLSVFGDTEFQVDCTKSAGCGVADTTTAQFTLFVNQWKSDGSLCHSDSVSVSKQVSYSVHHIYVPLHMPNFAVSTSSGCIPRFNAYVKVDRVSGMNGKVQGIARGLTDGNSPTPTHNSDMSHIFAVPF